MHFKDIYAKYFRYARDLREKVSREQSSPAKEPLSENEFMGIWQSMPQVKRRRWLTHFEASCEQVVLSESTQYASVLSNEKLVARKAA